MNPIAPTTGALPTFGTFQPTTSPSAPAFGIPATTTSSAFGVASPSTGFSYGAGGSAFGTTGIGFGNVQFGALGKPATTSSTSFSLPTQKPAASSAGVGFNIAGAGAAPSLNIAAPSNTSAPTGFSFGTSGGSFTSLAASNAATLTNPTTAVASSATAFSLGQALSTTPGSLVATSTTSGAGAGLQITPAASIVPSALILNPPTTTNVPLSLGVTAPASSTAATTTAIAFGVGSGTSIATVAPTTESTTSVSSAKSSVNFAEMDDTIHKWTLELVELEQTFLNQMDQVRDWDRLLLSTGDKIVSMNDSMQKVKLRQQQLDHELDFIVAQQRELVECLQPLEKEFSDITVSDPERNSIYQRAENLNTQLQQVSDDLKGVIEHINERNRSQDTSDPIVQIGRILNAHMNSLQWVDQNTAVIQQMLDQIGKMRDIHRRDTDSTQNL